MPSQAVANWIAHGLRVDRRHEINLMGIDGAKIDETRYAIQARDSDDNGLWKEPIRQCGRGWSQEREGVMETGRKFRKSNPCSTNKKGAIRGGLQGGT